VGHHSFKTEGRIAMEALEERSEGIGSGALAAHPGIDLEVNREGAKIRGARGGLEFIELPRIPDDCCEFVTDDVATLAGKDAADYEDARFGAKVPRLYAFFNAGDAEPTGPGAHSCGRAYLQRVTIGIGLDDGQKFNLRTGKG
jgi:hypothetical protein